MMIKKISFSLFFSACILLFATYTFSQPGTIYSKQKQNIAFYGYDFLIPLCDEEKKLDIFAFQVMNRLELLKTRKEIVEYISTQRTHNKRTILKEKEALKWLTTLYKDAVFSTIKHKQQDSYDEFDSVYNEFLKLSPTIHTNSLQDTAPHFSKRYSKRLCQYVEAINADEHEFKKTIHRPSASNLLDIVNDRLSLSQNYFESIIYERYKSDDFEFKGKAQILERLITTKDWGLVKYALSYFQYLEEKGELDLNQQQWLDSIEKEVG